MGTADSTIGVTIAATDEATKVIKDTAQASDSLISKGAELGAQFVLTTEAISRAAGMVKDFTEGAIATDAAVSRSAIAMRMGADEASGLDEEIKGLAASALGGLYSHRATALAFQSIADEGRGLAGTLGIVEAAMNVAAATGEDLTATTVGIEDIMSAFNLTAADTARIGDVMINTWKETGVAVGAQIGDLVRMGQVFTGLGMSIEESSALLGVLKDKGISNIQGLLTGFQQMTTGTGMAAEMMDRFGISAFDSTGKLKPMTQVFGELRDSGATAEDMFVSFGQRSAVAMTAVIDSLDQVKATAESNFEATGAAAKDAGQYMESDAAAAQEFEAAMETLKDELAEGLLPALSNIMGALQPLFKLLTDYPEIIYLLVAAFVAYKIALIAYTIMQWVANAAAWAFPAFWIIGAIVILIAAIYLLNKHWEEMALAMAILFPGFFLLIYLVKQLVEHWDEITAAVTKFGDYILGGFQAAMSFLLEGLAALIGMILEYFNLHEKLYEMGREAMDGFIDGLKDAADGAGDVLADIAGDIADYFGGSLPERGPLRNIVHMGEDLMGGYSAGMRRGAAASSGPVAATIAEPLQVNINAPTGSGGGGTVTHNHYNLVSAEDFMALVEGGLVERTEINRRTFGQLPSV